MNAALGPSRIRRLLLALDPSADRFDHFDQVAALAARLEAEIQGLFVEDTDLLGLAGHTVVRTLPSGAQTRGPLDPDLIRRTLRHQIDEARRAVTEAAQRCNVRASFEVRRGRTAMTLLESAGEEDLIVISRSMRGFGVDIAGARSRTGAAVRDVVRATNRSVFVVGDAATLGGPFCTAFDGSPACAPAVAFAATIAERRRGRELVFLLPPDSDAEALKKQAMTMIDGRGVLPKFETLEQGSVEAICGAVSRRRGGVLVVGAGQAWPGKETVPDLLENIACSIVLVR